MREQRRNGDLLAHEARRWDDPLRSQLADGRKLIKIDVVDQDRVGFTSSRAWRLMKLLPRAPCGDHCWVNKPQHRADRFLELEADPREGGASLGDERATLVEYLRRQRLTLQIKCEGLDTEQLARRAIEPSTVSLLGLVRHMAEVERTWFRRRFSGQDVPKRYQSEAEPDGDFDGAVAERFVVDEAWAAWRDEVAFAEQFARDTDLGFVGQDGDGNPISLRELLVHMIEEYARHNGHADLLRERIDGRIGQ